MSKNLQKVKVTKIGSAIGREKKQRLTLLGLGLKKMNSSVILLKDGPTLGMINKVKHLVKVEEL